MAELLAMHRAAPSKEVHDNERGVRCVFMGVGGVCHHRWLLANDRF